MGAFTRSPQSFMIQLPTFSVWWWRPDQPEKDAVKQETAMPFVKRREGSGAHPLFYHTRGQLKKR